MFRRTALAPAFVFLFSLCRASAAPPTPLFRVEEDFKTLDAAVAALALDGGRTESRRPLAPIFDALSRDAAELGRAEPNASPDSLRQIERLERDAAQAALDEHEFWKGTDASRPALSAAAVAALRSTQERLAQDLEAASGSGSGTAATPRSNSADPASFDAQDRAAQVQEREAETRAQKVLIHSWRGWSPEAAAATAQPSVPAPTGACPMCNSSSHSVSDLHTAVQVPAVPQTEKRGVLGSIYDGISGTVGGAYEKAVFAKNKMEEATGPVVTGVIEGFVDTASGITLGSLLWAVGKLLSSLGLGALLSGVGVGEAVLALRLRQMMLAVGVVMTAAQLYATVSALRLWLAAKPGSAESTNALREFVSSATGLVLAIALAALGLKAPSKPGKAPPEPRTTEDAMRPLVQPALLDDGTIRESILEHAYQEKFDKGRISGCHDLVTCQKYLSLPQPDRPQLEVVSMRPFPGLDEVYIIEYKTPNGKNKLKTVFDIEKYIDVCTQAASKAQAEKAAYRAAEAIKTAHAARIAQEAALEAPQDAALREAAAKASAAETNSEEMARDPNKGGWYRDVDIVMDGAKVKFHVGLNWENGRPIFSVYPMPPKTPAP